MWSKSLRFLNRGKREKLRAFVLILQGKFSFKKWIYKERYGEKAKEKIFAFSLRVGMRVKIKAFANIVCSKRNCAHLALFSKCALCDVYIYLCRIRLPLPGVRNPQLKSARYLRPPTPPPPLRALNRIEQSRSFFPISLSCLSPVAAFFAKKEMERKMSMKKKE